MFIKKEVGQEEIILNISGPLNDNTTAECEKYLDDIVAGTHRIVTVNMAEVDSINSTCLGKILRTSQLLLAQNRLFRIVGCSDLLYSTFRKLKVENLIMIEKTPAL
ncbi:MAG TPA: anti-sigma factor antagonist [Spirochaetales bacterium]|nr:anti-sigma factor antagonist [Spirochaetales bacterium]